MAVIWELKAAGVHYQVRTAGSTIRLYTDNVFHTQYNTRHQLSGGVWDLISLPCHFYRPGQIKRALVLGVGGGAVIKHLSHHGLLDRITGIDLNPVHLYVAEHFFGIRDNHISLKHADAHTWLTGYTGKPFDLIVEDIFKEEKGRPVRAISANVLWFNTLIRCLSDQGILVLNNLSRKDMLKTAFHTHASIRWQFGSAFQLTVPGYGNIVMALTKEKMTTGALLSNLKSHPALGKHLQTGRLKYSIRTIHYH
jgi:spermidine synthase